MGTVSYNALCTQYLQTHCNGYKKSGKSHFPSQMLSVGLFAFDLSQIQV